MKDKHKAWANLGRKPKPAPTPIIRLLDLPGIRELEDKCLIGGFDRGGRPDGPFDEKLHAVSMKLFGITASDTKFELPYGYFDLPGMTPRSGPSAGNTGSTKTASRSRACPTRTSSRPLRRWAGTSPTNGAPF